MDRKIKTIAIQVDDWDFIEQYEKRVKESGLSLKNYLVGLMKADIALNQTQNNDPIQEAGGNDETFAPEETATPAESEEQPEEKAAPTESEERQDETAARQDAEGLQTAASAAPEEMMNLFVKITKGQREALEAHKNETGETVGNVLNRLIDDFLDHADSLPEGFEEAYRHYSSNVKTCDTTCSARIPSRVNQELTDYLSSFGGSRNALMASLVELELKGQELTENESEAMDSGIQMM